MNSEIKLLVILSSVILVIFLGSFFVMANHEDIAMKPSDMVVTEEPSVEEALEPEETEDTKEPVVEEPVLPQVEDITGLLIGLDADGSLTDVLMVGNYNVETNEIKIVSVPRDLEIDYRTEPFKSMRNAFNEKVNSGQVDADLHQRAYSKVNEIYYDTGKTTAGLYYTKEVVEEITGLEIDHIAFIDVYGFKDVVDAVGGVDFYVPQDMHYSDPVQDLYIDLKEGQQVLDGDHAMQMVRYRKYVMGDIQRIQVQQDFMVELAKKMTTIKDAQQIMALAKSIYGLFESDFGLNVALDYTTYVFELELENLLDPENIVTIPSWGEKEEYEYNGSTRVRYHQYWDPEKAREVVDELMNN